MINVVWSFIICLLRSISPTVYYTNYKLTIIMENIGPNSLRWSLKTCCLYIRVSYYNKGRVWSVPASGLCGPGFVSRLGKSVTEICHWTILLTIGRYTIRLVYCLQSCWYTGRVSYQKYFDCRNYRHYRNSIVYV